MLAVAGFIKEKEIFPVAPGVPWCVGLARLWGRGATWSQPIFSDWELLLMCGVFYHLPLP